MESRKTLFSSFFDSQAVNKTSRNVLIVDLDSISDFQSMQNVYAKPQQIVKITAPNDEALIEMLELYQEQMITTFKNFDIENVQRTHVKTFLLALNIFPKEDSAT